MKKAAPFRSLPNTLLLMMAVFALVPFWSLSFLPWPWEILQVQGTARGALSIFTYWLAPLLICATILFRSVFFVALFFLECVAMVAVLSVASSNDSATASVFRYGLAIVAFLSGFIVARKDIIYPFFSSRERGWRMTPRVAIEHPLRVAGGSAGHRAVTMENASATGLAFSGPAAALGQALKGKNDGDQIELLAVGKDGEFSLHGRISWVRNHGDTIRVGVSVPDTVAMQRLLDTASASSDGVGQKVSARWARNGLQRAVLVLWAGSTLGTLMVPACGVDTEQKRTVVDSSGNNVDNLHGNGNSFARVMAQQAHMNDAMPECTSLQGGHPPYLGDAELTTGGDIVVTPHDPGNGVNFDGCPEWTTHNPNPTDPGERTSVDGNGPIGCAILSAPPACPSGKGSCCKGGMLTGGTNTTPPVDFNLCSSVIDGSSGIGEQFCAMPPQHANPPGSLLPPEQYVNATYSSTSTYVAVAVATTTYTTFNTFNGNPTTVATTTTVSGSGSGSGIKPPTTTVVATTAPTSPTMGSTYTMPRPGGFALTMAGGPVCPGKDPATAQPGEIVQWHCHDGTETVCDMTGGGFGLAGGGGLPPLNVYNYVVNCGGQLRECHVVTKK